MTKAAHSDKQQILNAVCEQMKQKLPKAEYQLCQAFTMAFFGTMSFDDLIQWSKEDLYGAALNFWALFQNKKPNENKIKIYNPNFENYGWQSTHTVIEVLTQDMPFLVESIRIAINRLDISLHLAVHMGGIRVARNAQGQLTEIVSKEDESKQAYMLEAPMLFIIDKQSHKDVLEQLHTAIEKVLADNFLIVRDWMAMRERVLDACSEYNQLKHLFKAEDISESQEFLKWLENHHFTFLGMRDYELIKRGSELSIEPIAATGYGILSDGQAQVHAISLSALPKDAQKLALSPQMLIIAKTEIKASVHRDTFIDYIGIKKFNDQGEVIGERRVYGLFTSAAYYSHIKDIPLLRLKVAHILRNLKLDPRSHAGRIILNILESMPRDDLIQADENDLLVMAEGIFHLQDRKRIRLFSRTDVYNRFISALVYVPKELYNTQLRSQIEAILAEGLNASSISFSTLFSESVLARIHFMIHLKENSARPSEEVLAELESKIIEVGRTWSDDLNDYLIELHGEEIGNQLFNRYKSGFTTSYMAYHSPRVAVIDIKYLEQLHDHTELHLSFYREFDDLNNQFRMKLYQRDETIALSDVLPIIENLGMRAISERPFQLKLKDGQIFWINEFSMDYPNPEYFDFDLIKESFEQAFVKLWQREAENDVLNKLVLAAGMDWHVISMLRAYAKYFKQMGITYSHEYIADALLHNVDIAKKLALLFSFRFSPKHSNEDREQLQTQIILSIEDDLEQVSNLDEDKILRQYVSLIKQTLRTNFYQDNCSKPYISFKLNSAAIPGIPKPYPRFEIFVYSPRFEGIHLRCSKVSRGGLRWSDRPEDFRTEVLGLMKAQQVKNAVIVPNGAKGGFVPKFLDKCQSRDEVLAEGVACYQLFIRGLLDITDNYVDAQIRKPNNVIEYDGDDPYLVVAADKGTASFSDYANAIAKEYNFWLGDAFASGGSNGYDHKKMAITARGAWESVKRHFYYLGKDIQTTDFTVVGIGDMAGDVFGNGMLLSRHIRLLAAFNHQHIFIDPQPIAETSFKERQRMFNLPRSSWADYDKSLISKGGGIFERSAKYIQISTEMAEVFGIQEARLEPNELIRKILMSKVELLWSGGIGTFVKSSKENNLDVGDRSNDAIRVNANELRCQVVGEGGNLGFTQRARIEYALAGGRIYTDFIDNSGGVSCSDKEVNIKILLDRLVKDGELTHKHRDSLLVDMTDEVAALVLKENINQTKSISLWAAQAPKMIALHARYMEHLEKNGQLDRKIEFLPSEKVLNERKRNQQGLVIPEVAVLFCYSKILLKEELLKSNLIDEAYFEPSLRQYFPKTMIKKYEASLHTHPLKREIIATYISNLIVNEMGATFIYRLQDETGAPVSAVVSAYLVVRNVLKIDEMLQKLAAIQHDIDAALMTEIQILHIRLARRLTRWLLRYERRRLNIQESIDKYAASVDVFRAHLMDYLGERYRNYFADRVKQYQIQGLPQDMAYEVSTLFGMFAIFDIIEISILQKVKIDVAASAFFAVGDFLHLEYVRVQIIMHSAENHWASLARESIRDDLDAQQRQLTFSVLNEGDDFAAFSQRLESWSQLHQGLIERWNQLITQLKTHSEELDFTMFFVAMRELLDLTQTALQSCADGDNCEFIK